MSGPPPTDKSEISKGYMVHMGKDNFFSIGATYERKFSSSFPDIQTAKDLLQNKLEPFTDRKIIGCKSGVRVCSKNHYFPIVERISDKVTVFTALGSRGLLYHGLLGRALANRIAKNEIIA